MKGMTPEARRFHSVFFTASRTRLLSVSQILTLVLDNSRGIGWYPKDISEITGVAPNHLSNAKEELVNAGFLVEHTPERDKRRKKWYLTDAGKMQADTIWANLTAIVKMREDWVTRLPEETPSNKEIDS
jgi:DNA-binding MarR family transcriptional regulator